MKRNNIFMLAYIIFIFLCVEVKSFWDFPMWGKIIAAVTTASWLFALSDCFSCAADLLRKVTNTQSPLIDAGLYELAQMKEYLRKRTPEDTNEGIQEVEACEVRCNRMRITLRRMRTNAKAFEAVSIIVTLIAFLTFLCVLCFDFFYSYFVPRQDSMTVISFGMILLAQFGLSVGSEYITKMNNDLDAIIKGWTALVNVYKEEAKYNAH